MACLSQLTRITLPVLLAPATPAKEQTGKAPTLTQWQKHLWGDFVIAKITQMASPNTL